MRPSAARLLCCAATSRLPYPRAAVACVLARNEKDSHKYLLVKRGKPPGQGKWSLPGGKLELGETVLAGALREVQEETGLAPVALRVHPWPITSTDAIYPAEGGGFTFHYSIAQVFAWVSEAHANLIIAADDAADVCWFSMGQLECLPVGELAGNVLGVISLARQMHDAGILCPPPSLDRKI